MPKKELPKQPKKKTLAQKIAERESKQADQPAQSAEPQETEQERKLKLAKHVMESDLENTRDLFGAVSLNSGDALAAAASSGFDSMIPNDKDSFDAFVKLVTAKTSNQRRT